LQLHWFLVPDLLRWRYPLAFAAVQTVKPRKALPPSRPSISGHPSWRIICRTQRAGLGGQGIL